MAPVAVKVADVPRHMLVVEGLTVKIGVATTETVALTLLVQVPILVATW